MAPSAYEILGRSPTSRGLLGLLLPAADTHKGSFTPAILPDSKGIAQFLAGQCPRLRQTDEVWLTAHRHPESPISS